MASEILLFALSYCCQIKLSLPTRERKKNTRFVMKSHEHRSYQIGLSHLLLSVKPYTQLSTAIVSLVPYLPSTLTNPIPWTSLIGFLSPPLLFLGPPSVCLQALAHDAQNSRKVFLRKLHQYNLERNNNLLILQISPLLISTLRWLFFFKQTMCCWFI